MSGSSSNRKLPRVITFPPSADSETGRWALDYYGVPVDERRHAPPFIFAAIGLNKGEKFPLYIDEGLKLSGVEQILDHFNERSAPTRQLTPPEASGTNRDALATFQRHNGPSRCHVGIYPSATASIHHDSPAKHGFPCLSAVVRPTLLPDSQAHVMERAQAQCKPNADEALETIKSTFAYVEDLLVDNRQWLVGNRMTLADLSFAVSGAPLVLPEGYGGYPNQSGPIPTLEQWPAEQRSIIEQMRQTRAGQFILRMYREERYRPFSNARVENTALPERKAETHPELG